MRTLLISDSFAHAFLAARPGRLWEPGFKLYRDRAIITPEYGVLYIAAALRHAGIDFEVVNVVADLWDDLRWFEVSDASESDPAARAELDALTARMRERLLALVSGADVVMIPMSYYYAIPAVRDLVRAIRASNPRAVLVTGGNFATQHADELVRDGLADVVVRGEGEDTIVQLLPEIAARGSRGRLETRGITYRIDGAVTRNPDMPRIGDLDRLPHLYSAAEPFHIARRHLMLKTLMPHGDYFIGSSFLTSRGCPEECQFCLDPKIWKRRVRFHSPAYVADVVRFCWEHYHRAGEPNFYFGDATFTLRKARLHDICERIAGIGWRYNVQTRADAVDDSTLARMKAAGFASVALGAESFDDHVLTEVVRKRQTSAKVIEAALAAKRFGIRPILTFIAGLPGESRASMLRTVDILRANGLDDATFFPLVVFKGTPFYDQYVRGKTSEEIEAGRFDANSEEYCFLSDEFPAIDDLMAWAAHLNDEIHRTSEQAERPTDAMLTR